ncbi:hypothetical protein HGM15179_008281 [Zosterops borbonicus]|uniref:Coiled-coil domain-containing protein 181 n=1 Tax=Zosterops borbonicus TaxID=364589 RepID=A0A8K1LM39_9PASS|nr:hypothetical protein HGM15179_008281 [Zosterops borbonicus]
MSEKEDQGDVGDVTESAEYEDDFEKDPESLTEEEEKQNSGEKENPEEKDAEAQEAADRSQEDNEEENLDQQAEEDEDVKVIYSNEKYMESGADTKQKDQETEGESSIQESKLENEQGEEEDKEANKDLENPNPEDQSGEQKLEAPPPEDAEADKADLARTDDVSDTKAQQASSLPADSQVKETAPPDSKGHPESAQNYAKDRRKQKTESAGKYMKGSTYTLTPRQKELRMQIELRKERLKREEEEMQRELEELKRRENELVYRAWLLKKKEQIKEEKRNCRAKQLEELRLRVKEVHRDPEEAYRLWLKKKHQQYVKERRIEYLRRQTEEVSFFPSAEECDRAFRDWLRRKREEKQAAELEAKARARQIRLEVRRARKMRNIHYI